MIQRGLDIRGKQTKREPWGGCFSKVEILRESIPFYKQGSLALSEVKNAKYKKEAWL